MGIVKQQAIYFQSCKALILFDSGAILRQEIEPKKATYLIKNVGSIKRVRVAFYGKNKLTLRSWVNIATTQCCGET